MTESRIDRIVAYGDSLTESGQGGGGTWEAALATLTGAEIINCGKSGQESGSIAVRQGGITLATTAAVTISTAAAVQVPVAASVTPCNMRSASSAMPVVLGGVRGKMTILTGDTAAGIPSWARSTGVGMGSFTPDAAPASPVTIPSGTTMTSQDVVDHPEYAECLHTIWVGTNDYAFAGSSAATGAVAAVRAMVARLQAAVDTPKYLVMGATTWASEVSTTPGYGVAKQVNAALAAEFGSRFIDIRQVVVDDGVSLTGITPTAADTTSLQGDTVPASLTVDSLHFNALTRDKIVAPTIFSALTAQGWIKKKEEPTVAFTPKTDWKAGDTYTADRMVELEAAAAAGEGAAQSVTDLAADVATRATTAALTDGLAKKVDANIGGNKIFATASQGGPSPLNYNNNPTSANQLVTTSTGGALVVGPATADNHAMRKIQVDTALATKANTADVPTRADFDALVARVAALETPAG